MKPLVSVILPVYNRENTIERSIDSVLAQSYINLELIIVDDGSTDNTVDVIKEYRDKRIKVICQHKNMGANSARNRGILEAHGEYIAFQDSDDEWLQDKLYKQIIYMVSEKLCASYCPYILCENNIMRVVPKEYEDSSICKTGIKKKLKENNIIGTPTLVIHKCVVEQCGMLDEEMPRLQDYEFAIRIAKKFEIGYLNEPLVKAYRLQKSISMNNEKLLEAELLLLRKHLDFIDLKTFLCRYFKECSFIGDENIKWEAFQKVIKELHRKDKIVLEESYKIALQYIYMYYSENLTVYRQNYISFISHLKTRHFAIYGAGVIGKQVKDQLEKRGLEPAYFFVTKKNGVNQLEGIPIVELSSQEDKTIPVIIAVSIEKQSELIENLLNNGFYSYCLFPN